MHVLVELHPCNIYSNVCTGTLYVCTCTERAIFSYRQMWFIFNQDKVTMHQNLLYQVNADLTVCYQLDFSLEYFIT
jgi:hypothetical protein